MWRQYEGAFIIYSAHEKSNADSDPHIKRAMQTLLRTIKEKTKIQGPNHTTKIININFFLFFILKKTHKKHIFMEYI